MDAFIPVFFEIVKKDGAFIGIPFAIVFIILFYQKYKVGFEPCSKHVEMAKHVAIINNKITALTVAHQKDYSTVSTDIKLINNDLQYVKRDIQQLTKAMPMFADKMNEHKESFEVLISNIKNDMDKNMADLIRAVESKRGNS